VVAAVATGTKFSSSEKGRKQMVCFSPLIFWFGGGLEDVAVPRLYMPIYISIFARNAHSFQNTPARLLHKIHVRLLRDDPRSITHIEQA
jgi:hypothetical protein